MTRSLLEAVVGRFIVAYFDLVYRLLLGSAEGRRFIIRAVPPGAPAAHSYLTAADMDELVSFLDLSPGELVLDLGCGYGEVAIAVHRRTGADVIGVEASARALVEARRRIAAAHVEEHVRVIGADLASVPAVAGRARAAYEIDALMFMPGRWSIYYSLLQRMGPGSRIFATTIEFGRTDPGRFRRRLLDAGIGVGGVVDISAQMAAVSELRRRTARDLLHSRGGRLRGRLALLAIVAEESLMQRAMGRDVVRRWRLSVRS